MGDSTFEPTFQEKMSKGAAACERIPPKTFSQENRQPRSVQGSYNYQSWGDLGQTIQTYGNFEVFGLVSYNALGRVFVSNLDMKHLIMTADAYLEAK